MKHHQSTLVTTVITNYQGKPFFCLEPETGLKYATARYRILSLQRTGISVAILRSEGDFIFSSVNVPHAKTVTRAMDRAAKKNAK